MREVTSLADLQVYAQGQVVELPGFFSEEPFVVRLRRPSLLALTKSGKIPNALLSAANELFTGKQDKSDPVDLSEIMGDDHVTVIEDMFTPEERTEFHLDNKEFDVNACFAQNHDRNIDSLSDETKRKFTKLIENIMMG